MNFRILAHRVPYRDRIELAALRREPDGRQWIGKPIEMRIMEEGEFVTDPTLSISTEAAQELIDELWRCGLRPTEGTGSAGSLAATERHLADMRTIGGKRLMLRAPKAAEK